MQGKLYKISDLEVHPYNEEKVPYIPHLQKQTLREDIKKYGLLYPLILQKGTTLVIDGKNRLWACRELGFIEVPCIEKEFEDEAELKWFILTRAAKNRNLSTAQRAAFAALTVLEMRKELGIEGSGRPKKCSKNGTFFGGRLIQHTAREWNVSHTNVQLALNVKKVSDDFFYAILDGEKKLTDAREFLAKLKIKQAAETLIPELKRLVEDKELSVEASIHLSALSEDEQKLLVEMFSVRNMTSQGTKEAVHVVTESRNDEELKRLKEELLALKDERRVLMQRLEQANRELTEYELELERLKTEDGENSAAQVKFYEDEVERLTGEKDDLHRKMEDLLAEKDRLLEEYEVRYADLQERHSGLQETLREFIKMLKKRKKRRGRRAKNYYERHIDKLEEKIEKLKYKYQDLKEKYEAAADIIGVQRQYLQLTNQKRDHVQSLDALRAVYGTLKSSVVQRLPDDIEAAEKDGLEAMELFFEILETVLDLGERMQKAGERLHSRITKQVEGVNILH